MQINRDNTCKNKHRVDYDYKVGDKFMLTNPTTNKYEKPYKGPFLITQCFTNGTVNLQYGAAHINHHIVSLSHISRMLKLKILIQKYV